MGSLLSANLSFRSSGLYQFSKNKQENYDKEACTWLVGRVLVNSGVGQLSLVLWHS